MPPSGFSQAAINGLLIFVRECYKDLQQEVKDGKKNEGEALEAEIKNIGDYLIKFKI